MPAATVSAPPIWTRVMTRYNQSSLSYADANQVKFSQPHQTAKNAITKLPTAPQPWWWPIWSARPIEASDTATTKVRSKKSSSGVAARCDSCGSRGRIGGSSFDTGNLTIGATRDPMTLGLRPGYFVVLMSMVL